MIVRPQTLQGYRLFQEGVIALSRVEANGMRIDVPRIQNSIAHTGERIARLKEKLRNHEIGRVWRKRYGLKTNFDSREQLGSVLYGVLKYPVTQWTGDKPGEGRPSTDEAALEELNIGFVRGYLLLQKLIKARGTYLKGILREVHDGFIHPVYNLHLVSTLRGSCDSPNFQNMPVRDPMIAELVRSNIISRFGMKGVVGEFDYKALEVCIAACYHKDPVMLTYIKDPLRDMHRDMAAQLYFLKESWVKAHGKNHRYGAKNKFVFPQFYGDFYVNCAKALWAWMIRAELEGPDGAPLREHLKAHGITGRGACDPDQEPIPGSFEAHVKEVEDDFWNNRFKVYGKWKRKWWEKYQETGGFDLLSGFRINGVFRRNEVINYPVQGSAFHCLLWSLIRLQKEMRKARMRSVIGGQIHDSIIPDIYLPELNDLTAMAKEIMMNQIRKEWPWIIVPLTVEFAMCQPGESWYDKKEVEI